MVYIFLADGFEEIEALAPLDIMRRANIDVKTVGVTEIEEVGRDLACLAERTINAMPANKCSKLTLIGFWG